MRSGDKRWVVSDSPPLLYRVDLLLTWSEQYGHCSRLNLVPHTAGALFVYLCTCVLCRFCTALQATMCLSLGEVSCTDPTGKLTRMKDLQEKPGIKLSLFVKNVSCLSIHSSYHIWLCRNDLVFVTPSYLPAPFQSSPEGKP